MGFHFKETSYCSWSSVIRWSCCISESFLMGSMEVPKPPSPPTLPRVSSKLPTQFPLVFVLSHCLLSSWNYVCSGPTSREVAPLVPTKSLLDAIDLAQLPCPFRHFREVHNIEKIIVFEPLHLRVPWSLCVFYCHCLCWCFKLLMCTSDMARIWMMRFIVSKKCLLFHLVWRMMGVSIVLFSM